jgi:hypothetical protein
MRRTGLVPGRDRSALTLLMRLGRRGFSKIGLLIAAVFVTFGLFFIYDAVVLSVNGLIPGIGAIVNVIIGIILTLIGGLIAWWT